MTWAQYWDFQIKTFELQLLIYGIGVALAGLTFIGIAVYLKIQSWRGK